MIEYFLMALVAAGTADAGTLAAADAGAPGPKPVSPADFKNPVDIRSDKFEIQGRRNEAIWSGNVRAVRGKTILTCDRLIAHYNKDKAQEINRMECVGDVEATHGDMWARGERADFDNVAGLLVVTGSPEARKGPNQIRGARILFDVTRDTISVERAETIFNTAPTRAPRSGGAKKGGGRK